MISVNVLLSLLFIVSNYVLWGIIVGASWSYYGAVASWSPLFVTPTYHPLGSRAYYLSPSNTTVAPTPLLNIPFLLFWIMLGANLYFIIRLQRSKSEI
jgi:hypothetical protein